MQVKDVMIPAVSHLEPDMSLRDAAERMKALNMNPMPVIENGAVVGVLSERTLVDLAARDGLAVGSHSVREAMSTEVQCCNAEWDLGEALQRSEEGHGARMPVVDADGRLVGLVSIQDLRRGERAVDGEVTAVEDVNSISQLVDYDDDRVDFMSDSSFPASDPIPPPSTTGPAGER